MERTLRSISTITRAEVYAGCHPADEIEAKKLLDYFETFPIESSATDLAGQYVFHYYRRGIIFHSEDALIGATAVTEGLNLVTQNVTHFPMLSLDNTLIRFSTR